MTVAKPKKEISMEEALWKSADKLRGSVEPAEYKHVVPVYSSLNLQVINGYMNIFSVNSHLLKVKARGNFIRRNVLSIL